MKFNMKKLLLTGTAIVAVSSFTGAAQAADLTIGADATWASAGGKTGADVANANAGDNVDGNTAGAATLTITNDGTADDGSANKNTFSVGNVTNTGAGDLGILIETGSANDMTATIASGNIKGDMAVSNRNADDAALTATVTNGLTVGGTLNVSNFEDSVAKTVILNVGGNLNATGQVTVTAGGINGAHSTLNLSGNATFTGGAVLNDDTADRQANLNFNGTTAQTVTGTINGAAAGEGNLIISNAAGVTFNGVIGGTQALRNITIDSAGTTNAAATFKANVSATTITLGGVGTGTNTINFDTATADFTATGTINGVVAGENNVVNILGGKVLTQGSAWGTGAGHIDAVNVTGTGTKLATGAAITADAMTIGTGAILDLGGHTITAPISNAGTINVVADTGTIVGNITGTGNLNATNATVVTGNISQGTVTVGTGKTFTHNAAAGTDGTLTANSIVLTNTGVLTLDAAENKTFTVTGAITNTVPNAGNINLGAANHVESYVFNSHIGTSGSKINNLTFVSGANAKTVTFKGNVYANGDIMLGQEDIAHFVASGAQASSGNIRADVTGRGFINVGSASVNTNLTHSGTIGGGQAINGIKVFTGSTLNVSDNITTGAGTSVIDGTLNINASNNTVTFEATNAGVSDFNGTVNITGTGGAADNVTISTDGALTIDGALNTNIARAGKTTTLTGTGSATIGATTNTTITAGNQIILGAPTTIGAAGRTTTLNIQRTATFDPTATTVLTSGANITLAADSVLNVGIAGNSAALNNNDAITVITSAGGTNLGTALTGGQIKLVNTGLVTLANDGSDATNLKVKATINNPATTLESAYTASTASALIAFPTATNELSTARGNLLSAPTAAAATEIAESLAPTVDGGHIVGAMNTTQGTFNVANDRLAALRTGSTGMAAGNGQGNRFWVQGHGTTADQDRRSGVDGYDADSYGFAVGLDTETLSSNGIVGVAFSYADTEVDSRNANRTKSDIDSYQVTLYGSFDLDHATFINGMLAYTWHDVDTTRHNVGGINGLTARGSFDANQFSAQAVVGRDYKHDSMTVTPSLLAHWTHYDGDNYTETGAGNAGLVVNQDSVNKFELGAGVKASWDYQTASGMDVVPELRAGYRYDFIGDEVSTTNRFIGGGQAFTTKGADPAQHSFNAGGSLSLYTTDSWEFTANYDFDFKTDYHAHSGYLRAGVKF